MSIKLLKGDITKLKVDVIVNAANNSLLGGGGVDGAIHQAAGPELLAECKALNGCKTGKAKHTKAYKLLSKHIIHTVGPIWQGGTRDESKLLKSCYQQSFLLAKKLNCNTIAFPNISTGVYGYPKIEAADIALSEALNFLNSNSSPYIIYFVCYDEANYQIYSEKLKHFRL